MSVVRTCQPAAIVQRPARLIPSARGAQNLQAKAPHFTIQYGCEGDKFDRQRNPHRLRHWGSEQHWEGTANKGWGSAPAHLSHPWQLTAHNRTLLLKIRPSCSSSRFGERD